MDKREEAQGANQENKDTYGKIKELHQKISEEMWLLQKVLPQLDNEEDYNNVRKSVNFIQEVILKHFDWEEHEVFPIALTIGGIEIKQVVRELQQHHIIALSKFDIMADLIVKHGFYFQDEEIKNKFIAAAKGLLEVTLQNARKEDAELYPFLVDKKVKLDFKGQLR